jgi:Glycosyl transferases group 1
MKNILILTFWSYKDALIQTYTLPYVKIMHQYLPKDSKIYLLSLEKEHLKICEDEKESIRNELNRYGITLIDYPYYRFGFKAIIVWLKIIIELFFLIIKTPIHIIHAFCTPAGVAGYILSVLTNTPLLLDSYEPHAEASVENGDWSRKSFRFRILYLFERLQSHRAQFIISATQGMRKYALDKYGAQFNNFFVKPACTNLELFSIEKKKQKDLVQQFNYENKIVCVYAGKFGGIYLDKEVFDLFKVAQDYWKDSFRILLLTNQNEKDLQRWAKESGVDYSIIRTAFVFHSEIADYMGLADFAITPVKPIPTKRYCTPIKNGEYWAMGLPVISTAHISDDSAIIEHHQIGAVIHSFTKEEYLRVIQTIDSLLESNKDHFLTQKIRSLAYQYRSFDIAHTIYKKIYGNE